MLAHSSGKGVRPDELPSAIVQWTGPSPLALIVIEDGDWENGHSQHYSDQSLPPTLKVAALQTAHEFCSSHHRPELGEELGRLMHELGQPSLTYSEALTREFNRHHPPTSVRLSTHAPLLGQEKRAHQIYRPQPSGWFGFTAYSHELSLAARTDALLLS